MLRLYILKMNYLINFLSESVFTGACAGMVLLLVFSFISIKPFFNRRILIQTINITLLIGGTANFVALGVSSIRTFLSGNEEAGYSFLNRFFGLYWYAGWILLFIWIFLPQVFWFRKPRISLGWLVIVVSIQLLFRLFLFAEESYLIGQSSWSIIHAFSLTDYFEHLGLYLIISGLLYYGLTKRKQSELP